MSESERRREKLQNVAMCQGHQVWWCNDSHHLSWTVHRKIGDLIAKELESIHRCQFSRCIFKTTGKSISFFACPQRLESSLHLIRLLIHWVIWTLNRFFNLTIVFLEICSKIVNVFDQNESHSACQRKVEFNWIKKKINFDVADCS